ncbi:hypothetical protein [Propionispora hippei]|nr:hypothetical protein [Propionispora hippei]
MMNRLGGCQVLFIVKGTTDNEPGRLARDFSAGKEVKSQEHDSYFKV